MRISTLNTALQLSLKNDPSKGQDQDGDKDSQNPEGSDGQGQDQDQDGGDEGQGDSDTDKDTSDGSDKGDKSDKGEKGDKSDKSDKDGDQDGDTDEGYGDNSGGKGKHQGGGSGKTDDLTDVAQQLSDAINQGLFGTTDRDDALSETVVEEVQKTDRLQPNEARYNPIMRMYPNQIGHSDRDSSSVNSILRGIAKESGQVKVGLQRLIRAMEQTSVHHGTKDGRLSSRQYTKTWGELKGGKVPTRPYYKRSEKMDVSIACSVVVDQSSSMSGLKRDTVKGMIALADALNSVGAATQVTGFRYGGYHPEGVHGVQTEYCNAGGACIDVFQQFGERFNAVKGRFAHLRATGGTPTADGMQYALEGLSERNEAFRIMFVLTDGCPDGGHQQIINRQIRIAKEAGIHVVGVGLGRGTQGVVSSYPDHIVALNMAQLPEKLIGKLSTILKPSANKRGRRVAK